MRREKIKMIAGRLTAGMMAVGMLYSGFAVKGVNAGETATYHQINVSFVQEESDRLYMEMDESLTKTEGDTTTYYGTVIIGTKCSVAGQVKPYVEQEYGSYNDVTLFKYIGKHTDIDIAKKRYSYKSTESGKEYENHIEGYVVSAYLNTEAVKGYMGVMGNNGLVGSMDKLESDLNLSNAYFITKSESKKEIPETSSPETNVNETTKMQNPVTTGSGQQIESKNQTEAATTMTVVREVITYEVKEEVVDIEPETITESDVVKIVKKTKLTMKKPKIKIVKQKKNYVIAKITYKKYKGSTLRVYIGTKANKVNKKVATIKITSKKIKCKGSKKAKFLGKKKLKIYTKKPIYIKVDQNL